MSSTFVEVDGLNFDVEFNYHAGWGGSRDEPPEPSEVEILGIYVKGVELSQYLSSDVLVAIEADLYKQCESGEEP